MLKGLKTLALLGALLGVLPAFAYSKTMFPYTVPAGRQGAAMGCTVAKSGMTLQPGKWYTNFQACKAYADKMGYPLFAVWSNDGCIHCWYTDVTINDPRFRAWQQENDAGNVICCFMAGKDDTYDQVGSSAYNWMLTGGGKALNMYPLCALWWKKKNVNIHITGDDLCKGSSSAALSLSDSSIPKRIENVEAALTKAFAGWASPKTGPGSVGFETASVSVKENVGRVSVPLARTGGAKGAITVRVDVDERNTTYAPDAGKPRFAFEPQEISWPEGMGGTTNLVVEIVDDADWVGDGRIALKLELVSGDAKLGEGAFAIDVAEDDKFLPGVAGFVGADPCLAKKGVVYAHASDTVELKVGRMQHACGEVSVKLAVSDPGVVVGGTEGGVLTWGARDAAERTVTLAGLAAGTTTKVSLVEPSAGFAVLSASNAVSVVALPDDAPAFEQGTAATTLYRYVAASNVFPLAFAPTNKVAFTKLSGTLPAGLKVAYDAAANALAVSGVPTAKAGAYSACYQVKDGKVAGLAAKLDFTVVDPTLPGSADANPSVATARTFTDLPVVSAAGRLAGTLQLTVPAKGALSAKYAGAAGAVPLSAKNWTAFEPQTRELTARLVSTKAGYAAEARVAADGTVSVQLEDPQQPEGVQPVTADAGSLWSKANPATAWKGYYTVALDVARDTVAEDTAGVAPTGSGYLTLKMDTDAACRAGKVAVAGMLPGGATVSAAKVLSRAGEDACLPVYVRTATDELSVLLRLVDGRVEAALPAGWRHAEKVAEAGADYACDFAVEGALYRASMVPADLRWAVAADLDALPGFSSPTNMAVKFTPATGLFTGSFKVLSEATGKYVAASWKGVAVPATQGQAQKLDSRGNGLYYAQDAGGALCMDYFLPAGSTVYVADRELTASTTPVLETAPLPAGEFRVESGRGAFTVSDRLGYAGGKKTLSIKRGGPVALAPAK